MEVLTIAIKLEKENKGKRKFLLFTKDIIFLNPQSLSFKTHLKSNKPIEN